MPQQDTREQTRAALLKSLMRKLEADPYPSSTMMDMVEELLTPDDVEPYVKLLLERIDNDNFPSISMLHRVESFAS
jgi:hypothetical protein